MLGLAVVVRPCIFLVTWFCGLHVPASVGVALLAFAGVPDDCACGSKSTSMSSGIGKLSGVSSRRKHCGLSGPVVNVGCQCDMRLFCRHCRQCASVASLIVVAIVVHMSVLELLLVLVGP